MKKLIRVLALFTIPFLIVNCAKKRAEQFIQNEGIHIDGLAMYDGKNYQLKTGKSLTSGSLTSADDEVKIDANNEFGLNNFGIVEYKTDALLLGSSFPFRGRENTNYAIQYEVNSQLKKLIVYKLGKKKDIPIQELTLAIQVSKDTYKVPLISYEVSLLKVAHVQNENGENTNKLKEFPVEDKSQATHIKVKKESAENLILDNKFNVFPRNLFDGEWYYSATIISANARSNVNIGSVSSVDFQARSVSRIEFIQESNRIRGVNKNIDKSLLGKDINLETAVSIPVQHIDYKRATIGTSSGLTASLVNDKEGGNSSWKEKRYTKFDFASICTLGSCIDGDLKNLEIAKDYRGFTVFYTGRKTKIHYSFWRAKNKGVTPKIYHNEDKKLFGYFLTVKDFIMNHKTFRVEDIDKNVFLNRFYPENGVIKYHFSHETSPRFKKIAREAIEAWDKTFFEEAGTGIHIEIALDDDTVALGDLRYNVLNVVDTKDGGSLLGYGPSIVDSSNGEIVSATTNIYINPYREGLIRTMRNYVHSEIGTFKAKYLDQIGSITSSGDRDRVMTWKNSWQKTQDSMKDNYLGFEKGSQLEANLFEKLLAINPEEKPQTFNSINNPEFVYSFHKTNGDIVTKIKKSCVAPTEYHKQLDAIIAKYDSKKSKKDIKTYVDEINLFGVNKSNDSKENMHLDLYVKALKNIPNKLRKSFTHFDWELLAIDNCINKKDEKDKDDKEFKNSILEDEIASTILHELGHNFGLRHNFAASSDEINFPAAVGENDQILTSSVMDYQTNNVNGLIKPAAYDVAVIRFGYGDSVKLQNGEIVKLTNRQATIEENLEGSDNGLYNYKFCTDEDVSIKDPLCKRWDHGKNPEEVVNHIIDGFNSYFAVQGQRYDRAIGPHPSRFNGQVTQRYFLPLKSIYDKWRFHLGQFLGEQKYMQSLSEAEFADKLIEMSKHPIYKQYYQDYYKATQKIYTFLSTLAFTPPMFCIAKDEAGQIQTYEFESLRKIIFNELNKTVNDCNSPVAKKYLKNKLKMSYVRKEGELFNSLLSSLDVDDSAISPEISGSGVLAAVKLSYEAIGLESLRLNAVAILGLRMPTLRIMDDRESFDRFVPNFFDNPIYRADLMNTLFNRIAAGINADELNLSDIVADSSNKNYIYFSREKDFLIGAWKMFTKGLILPGELDLNIERMAPYKAQVSNNVNNMPQAIREAGAFTTLDNLYIWAGPEAVYAQDFVSLRNQLMAKKSASKENFVSLSEAQILEVFNTQLIVFTQAEFSTITFKEFIDANKANIVAINKISDKNLADSLLKMFSIEQQIIQLADTNPNYKPLLPLNAFDSLKRLFANLERDTNIYSKELVDTRVGNFLTLQDKKKADKAEYLAKKHEYNAQQDIIAEALLTR
jgi:predicted Zn-dependent protease